MSITTRGGLGLLGLGLILGIGCDSRPTPPRPDWYKSPVKALQVDPNDPAEVRAATDLESARLRYSAAIDALVAYYDRIGKARQLSWARKEQENLQQCQEFQWAGIQPEPPPQLPASDDEVTLVEEVVDARKAFLTNLNRAIDHYQQSGEDFKEYVLLNMQERFQPEDTFLYILSVELPPEDLVPSRNITAANELYDRALRRYQEGSAVPALADYKKQREALRLFKHLIRTYPESTRIALAAFYIGEIYKEYFQENYLAVLWYERALMWDPMIPRPVRFQTAVQYDFNLHDRETALEYYRAAIRREPYYKDNARYSAQRIRELEEMLAQQPAGVTTGP